MYIVVFIRCKLVLQINLAKNNFQAECPLNWKNELCFQWKVFKFIRKVNLFPLLFWFKFLNKWVALSAAGGGGGRGADMCLSGSVKVLITSYCDWVCTCAVTFGFWGLTKVALFDLLIAQNLWVAGAPFATILVLVQEGHLLTQKSFNAKHKVLLIEIKTINH